MASSTEDNVFSKLRQKESPEAQAQWQDDFNTRARQQDSKSQARQRELIDENSTLPTTISSITVLNAPHTCKDFLGRIFNPLLSANNDAPYKFTEALRAISNGVNKLNRFDIFHSPISVYLDRPDPTSPSSTPTDLSVFLSAREKGRLKISSGTWAGSNDGSLYGDLLLRNLFGGAENASLNASTGTRTRWSASGGFDTPILSNPDLRFEVGGVASSTLKSWASHEEVNRSGHAKLRYIGPSGLTRNEFGYTGIWRQTTGLASNASPTVRADAGDSFKSSLIHMYTRDTRDYPMLPSCGTFFKTTSEVAGLGPLQGDVAFAKFEIETQSATPLPIPFFRNSSNSGVSFTAGLRGGLLYPLPLGNDLNGPPTQSRINDRFNLGGPSDVRGFRFAGLGPRDGGDAVSGDVYAAGGASLLVPFPRVGKDVPLRLQAFVNGGRLVSLQDRRSSSVTGTDGVDEKKHNSQNRGGASTMTNADTRASVLGALQEMTQGELPSMAAGIGVVYAMDVARFEVNFSLPLVIRKGEEGRKGVGIGIGINFL